MKKITIYFSCLLVAALVANVAYAQEEFPRPLTDQTIGDNLNKDWGQRNPGSQNPSVQWFDSGDGYYGTYDNDNTPFMTFYDKDGGYMQTYKKGDWNSVNPSLKSSYDGSTYKNQEVTGYWESSDPSKKGSYLEVRDNNGKASRVWANEKGEMSPAFPNGKASTKKQK